MYKFITLLLLFHGLAFAKPAPDFTVNFTDLSKKISQLKGQVVYVDFWASWCKPCRKSFPWMNQMQQKHAAQGFQVIAVNLDTEPQLANRFLTSVNANFPIVYDPQGQIASRYQLIGMPSSYLIDKKGQIRFSHQGFFAKNQHKYESEITSLLNEME